MTSVDSANLNNSTQHSSLFLHSQLHFRGPGASHGLAPLYTARSPCVSSPRALACKPHLGEQLGRQQLRPGARGFLLSPAPQLLSVVQHMHERANQILCKLEDHSSTINDVPAMTNGLRQITKGKGDLAL